MLFLFLLSVSRPLCAADSFPSFDAVTIDGDVGKVCYAVTIADVNGDGENDIVAVTESRVLWFESPTWTSHTIIDGATPTDNVCIAAHDIDGDGNIDFALGAGWTKKGTIHWLSRGSSLDDPWNVHFIGEEPWTHRMRFADVLGKGTPQLVVSPLNATSGNGVRLTAFEIPEDPADDRWPTTVLSDDLNRMHNHFHIDLDGDKIVDTLTASREGVNLIRRAGQDWQQIKLGDGMSADQPDDSGAGEIKVGQLSDGKRFIATVEPMHGHTLAVYVEPATATDRWQRHVVDTGFVRGHAIWPADMDGDGDDDIVFGHSDTPETFGVIVYQADSADGREWTKHVVDAGTMACEDLVVEDLTGDGFPDIVAGGRATHNVKLYVQRR